jgi:hypothetical protein
MGVEENILSEMKPSDRLKICRDCEEFFFPTRTCLVCGCFMFVKARIKSQSCPLGKW